MYLLAAAVAGALIYFYPVFSFVWGRWKAARSGGCVCVCWRVYESLCVRACVAQPLHETCMCRQTVQSLAEWLTEWMCILVAERLSH